jgi:hypothetical protein
VIFKRKPVVIPPIPVIPDGWTVMVRQQERSYAVLWDYCSIAPKSVVEVCGQEKFEGSGFKSRQDAVDAAIESAIFMNREVRNRNLPWEVV